MSNHEHNRYAVSDRRGRTWGWLTAAVILTLIAVGLLYATGRWGEIATRTGGGVTAEQVAPGSGPSQPGVPNQKSR